MSVLDQIRRSRPCVESPVHSTPDFVTVIAQQCRQRADNYAVIASDARVTYRDLEIRVVALALRLTVAGVKSGSLVGISMSRGADELIAMLAVLTLGATYVPLDPSQPESRIAMIVADARPELVIVKPDHLLANNTFRTIIIGDGAQTPAVDPTGVRWTPSDDPDALAYVLFTSGSTGRPKGVEIPRRAVSNLLASMIRKPGLRRSDVLLAATTTMFDIAVLELFGPLCVGGTVHIVDSDLIRDGRRLRAVLEGESISVMQATPTMWHSLIDAGWHGDGRLRIFVGGEALSPDLARQLLQRGEVWNLYGPTETTVWSTCKRVDNPDRITIGRPIDNTEVYVLDEDGAVLPPGVTGELCIGGAGLARGYLGRPDLTAERFIQSPAGPPGQRIYRTGDLVRMVDDGELCYLGRADHQVKIRGFRIELGEIEHALGDLDSVNRAVVVTWEPAGAAATLVAFVVPSPGVAFEPREISRLLRQRLPAYMIPCRFIGMPSLPLTPNGKIDRAALPDPSEVLDAPDRNPRVTQPRTDTEACVYRIWSEVLSRNNIALDDDFFDLGGQSILAVRICDRIHRTLMVDLPVSALLDQRTIGELSAHIDGLLKGSVTHSRTSVVPIQPNGTYPAIFCVAGVGGNPLTFLDLAEALGPQQPFYALEHQGVDGKRRPHDSIEAMAQAFVRDIQAVQSAGPYILAGYSDGGLAAYEAARQMIEAGEDVPLLILLDTIRPRLAGWSRGQRVRQHWANVRVGGIGYVVRRIADRTVIAVGGITTRVRAGLAVFSPYRFRLAAVEMAGHRAAATYAAAPYQGEVLLFQSDPEIGSEGGIPARQHESNGWRDLVDGDLEVVAVDASHFSIVEGDAAVVVASEIGRALSSKLQNNGQRRA